MSEESEHDDVLEELTLMRQVVHIAPGMLAYWDRDQRCRFANRAYQKWFGVDPARMIGTHIRDLLGPLYPLNLPYIEGALRGEDQTFHREIPDPLGGSPRFSKVEYRPHVVDDRVQGFVVMVTDITDRRRLEDELVERSAEVEDLYDHAPCGYHSLDVDFVVRRINATELRWLGYDVEEVLGRPFVEFVGRSSVDRYHEAVRAVRSGVGCDVELDLRRKDGSALRVLASCAAYLSGEGDLRRIRMALVDISEIALARAEREHVIDELQDALRRVKTLSGLVPICAWCRKVRSDEGFYEQLEHYISAHTDAKFTHGICPDCARRIST